MTDAFFAVGDPHGCLNKLELLLKEWNPDRQRLVVLGDMVDRGDDSLGVILKCMKLRDDYGAVIIGGNHEQMFLDWLDDPTYYPQSYFDQGGRETVNSFFDGQNYATRYLPNKVAELILKNYANEVQFLRDLPDYYEFGDHVFVHGGVDFRYEDWKKTRKNDFRWIRREFHYGENHTGKTFVFGHTPTSLLNTNQSCGAWISPCQTKIGIDGGAVFGGYLLGLQYDEDGYTVHAA